MDKVSVVQSVDRPELARAINARCLREERRMDVLIEVSVAGEANKGGVAAGWAECAFARGVCPWKGFACAA